MGVVRWFASTSVKPWPGVDPALPCVNLFFCAWHRVGQGALGGVKSGRWFTLVETCLRSPPRGEWLIYCSDPLLRTPEASCHCSGCPSQRRSMKR